MFSQKSLSSHFCGVVALISISLLIAALLHGFSAKAQTTTIPLGTYTATPAELGQFTGMLVDEVKVTFLEGGKFEIGYNAWVSATGSYTVAGDRVEFALPWGTEACAPKGVYQWSLIGNKLTLAVAPGQTDDCMRRRIRMAQTYYKTDLAESLWKNIGPEGGTIRAILFHDNKIFAATDDLSTGQQFGTNGGGVFVSADNGQNWKPTRGIRGNRVYALAAYNGMLFAGAQLGYLFVSLDGGQTWELNNPPGFNAPVLGFAVSNGKLYAAMFGQGVWRLTDNPYVWEKAGTMGLTNQVATSLAAVGANLFVSTDGGGIFTSPDGNNWTPVNNGLTILRISTLAASGATLYAGSSNGTPATTPNEVFVTNDNGQNWARVGNGLAASFPPGFFNGVFQLAAGDGKLFAASSNGVIMNEGANWRIVQQGSPTSIYLAVAANGSQVLAGANFDGVWRSLDGGATWSAANKGLTARTITAVFKERGVLFAGANDGAFFSNDEGQSWVRRGFAGLAVRNFLAFDGKVYVGTTNGVFVTADQGQSGTRVSNGLGAGTVTRIVAVNNALYAAVYNAGVFRTTDGGQNWTAVNNNLTSFRLFDLSARGTTIFAATEDRGIFRSEEGQSWATANNGLPANLVTSLAVSGNTLLAAVWGQGVYRSGNNGETWAKSEVGLSPPGVLILYASGANVYATGAWNAGALRSTDGGQSWIPINTGFDPRFSYGYFADGATLYAATVFGVCHSQNLVNQQTTVSAANYSPGAITEKSIVAAFGKDLATSTEIAGSVPLPTALAGTTVRVRDSNGVERLAPLFFVSGGQINYQIPAGTAVGNATVSILNGNAIGATGVMEVKATAPSIFTANSSGSGAAAAVDAITGTAGPFNAKRADGQPNIIAVFGTGLGADATDVDGDVKASVTASIDGNAATLLYAGRSPGYVGLNQFNIELPANITSGTHTLTLTRGATSNTVTITIR